MTNIPKQTTQQKYDEMWEYYEELNDMLQAHDECNGCDFCENLQDRIDIVAIRCDELEKLLNKDTE